jgi:hypothetical protein
MAGEQSKYLVELYAAIKERVSKPDMDLTTIRDVLENLHLAAIEPEGVTTLKWMPTACRHCGVSRRTATRTASCCTATPLAAA